jgi:hypothetical protein
MDDEITIFELAFGAHQHQAESQCQQVFHEPKLFQTSNGEKGKTTFFWQKIPTRLALQRNGKQ